MSPLGWRKQCRNLQPDPGRKWSVEGSRSVEPSPSVGGGRTEGLEKSGGSRIDAGLGRPPESWIPSPIVGMKRPVGVC